MQDKNLDPIERLLAEEWKHKTVCTVSQSHSNKGGSLLNIIQNKNPYFYIGL